MAERVPDLIIANGFGALPALMLLQLAEERKPPMILINPMYPPVPYSEDYVPDKENKFIFSRATFSNLCWDLEKEKFADVFVILGKDDDVVDTKRIKDYFLEDRVFYLDGGHFLDIDMLSKEISEIYSFIEDNRRLEEKKFRKGYSSSSNSVRRVRAFITGSSDEKNLLYVSSEDLGSSVSDGMAVLKKYVKKILEEIKSNPRYSRLKIKFLSADELPAPDENLRAKFKDTDVLILADLKKDVMTKDIQRSLYIALDEVISHGGRAVLLSDDAPKNVFEKRDSALNFIYDYNSGKLIFADSCCESWGLYGSTRKGTFSEYARPREDRYTGVKAKEINMDNGSFTIKYSSHFTDDGILYIYYDGEKWDARDENGDPAFPEETAAVLKAAGDGIAQIIEEQNDYNKEDMFTRSL